LPGNPASAASSRWSLDAIVTAAPAAAAARAVASPVPELPPMMTMRRPRGDRRIAGRPGSARRATACGHQGQPELQERERTKFAAVTGALADALQERGAAESGARLLAQVGAAIFQTAFERWTDQPEHADFSAWVREVTTELASSLEAVDIPAFLRAGSETQ
jgi:hypothetical protein